MSLDWITVVWSMIAGAFLVLALYYLVSWFRQAGQTAYFAFAIVAFSMAVIALFELRLMRAQTPGDFGTILRWMHFPLFTLCVSLVVFLRLYLKAGRVWLAWSVCVLRLLVLILNFQSELNLHYLVITSLQQIPVFGGQTVSVAVGEANPWSGFGTVSTLLLLLFLLNVTMTCWRRGGDERTRAAFIGGSLLFWIVVAGGSVVLVHSGTVQSIYLVSLPFLAVVAAIGYLLGADAIRAERLARELANSEGERQINLQRMTEAAAAAGIAIWEWDVGSDEVWIFERGRALFAIAPDERIDLDRLLCALHPDDRHAMREIISAAVANGERFETDSRVVLPGGGERWIRSRGRVENRQPGTSTRVRTISVDITEPKQTGERFRRLVESAPFGMLMLDSSGAITLTNSQVSLDFGYTREELIGHPVEKLIPQRFLARHAIDAGDFLAAPSGRLMSGRQVFARHRDGDDVAVEIYLDTIAMPDGVLVLATIHNVSERVELAALLEQERAFLRQVIDITPNLIFAKDRHSRFTLVNQAVADIYGTTIKQLIGKTDADFNPNTKEVDQFRHMDLQVMDTLQERFIAEEKITDATGKIHWMQTIKRPVLDKHGVATQVLGAATDITSRKLSELEFARQRNEVAHLSRVMLLNEMSGSLAHELNQPLTAILSNAQAAQRFLAIDDPDIAEVRETMQDIVDGAKRAGEVILGLRMLLKKGEKRSEALDINLVVKDAIRLISGDLLSEGVDVTVDLAGNLPVLIGDKVQLQQVLLNLLMNASEIMLDNAATDRKIVVATARDDENNVCVTVRDSGPGIEPVNLARVFEPYFTTKPEGLGLGLQVCQMIIAAHNGRLWATNNEVRGATFHLTLPMKNEVTG